jgi:hypothetical protein
MPRTIARAEWDGEPSSGKMSESEWGSRTLSKEQMALSVLMPRATGGTRGAVLK